MKQTPLIDYLYGSTATTSLTEMWDSRRGVYLPVQSSPLKEYVNDVNRFLFSGGIKESISDLPDDHYGHIFLKDFSEKYIHPNLNSLWETLAKRGEIICVLRPSGSRISAEFFDKTEYNLTFSNNQLTEAAIKTIVLIDGKRYIYKFEVNAFNFTEYPLVLEEKETGYNWEAAKEINNHGFKRVPVQVIGINKSLTSKRGKPEFNWASLKLAISIASIEYGLDENLYFFGNPLLDSPDPDRTIKDLNAKNQVLQKLPPDEGGGHELLQPVPLSDTELEWLKLKKESFKRAMGITNTQETKFNDASGIALKIMNDGLISKAQEKWLDIVSYGLENLCDLLLNLANDLGIISLGTFAGLPLVSISRKQPYFAKTDTEKLQSLQVAQNLIEMGVDRAIALQETYYTHLSVEEVEKMLRPNLEDML